jgi:predicted MFS family arabinose efflux permease
LIVLLGLTVSGRWMSSRLEDRLRPVRIFLTAVLVILTLLLVLTVASLPGRPQ